jgi:hypothetical protein
MHVEIKSYVHLLYEKSTFGIVLTENKNQIRTYEKNYRAEHSYHLSVLRMHVDVIIILHREYRACVA